jgi:hypothetical protein
MGSAAPEITEVAWAPVGDCTAGTESDMEVTVTVTDADTDAGDLSFSGSATGCTGTFDAATSTITCPQAAPYASTVTVEDPEGNMDTMTFTIGVCEDGSAP